MNKTDKKIKEVLPPEGMIIPDKLAYVGRGGGHFLDMELGPVFWMQSHSNYYEGEWLMNTQGSLSTYHYALPIDSPLLEELCSDSEEQSSALERLVPSYGVSLPEGLPPVPEDGLEAMGWGWSSEQYKDRSVFFARKGDRAFGNDHYAGGSPELYYLRRPPKEVEEPSTEEEAMSIIRDLSKMFGSDALTDLADRAADLLERKESE